MKNKKIISLLLSLVFTLSLCTSAFADTVNDSIYLNADTNNVIQLNSSEIDVMPWDIEKDGNPFIHYAPEESGFETYLESEQSDIDPLNLVDLVLIGIYSADDKSVTVGVYNSSDNAITTSNLLLTLTGPNNSGSYTIAQNSWQPGMSRFKIYINQQSVEEQLQVSGSILDNGYYKVLEPGKTSRKLGRGTINQWSAGTYPTKEDSINRHFYKHHADKYLIPDNILSIQDYCYKAADFLNFIKTLNITGKENRDNAYKFYVGGKYIICGGTATSPDFPIYTYGGN